LLFKSGDKARIANISAARSVNARYPQAAKVAFWGKLAAAKLASAVPKLPSSPDKK